MDSGKPFPGGKAASKIAKQRSRRRSPGLGLSPLPLEWMDASTWRLPSGKALAEFALQAGFLAPLMLGAPLFSGNGAQNEADSTEGARRVTVPPVSSPATSQHQPGSRRLTRE